jgi:hypothetical protein
MLIENSKSSLQLKNFRIAQSSIFEGSGGQASKS